MTARVPLGGKKARGRVTLVDDADWLKVCYHSWHVWEKDLGPGRAPNGPYAQTRIVLPDGRVTMVMMHVYLLGVHTGIDHANGDGLDNRRQNLRVAGQPLNCANRLPQLGWNGGPKSSQYKGVTWEKPARGHPGRWLAQIRVNGRGYKLGRHELEVDAAYAYDAEALRVWGGFAWLNFPAG